MNVTKFFLPEVTGFFFSTSLTNLFPFIKTLALIAHPRHGLTAIPKPRVYCIESAPGRFEIEALKLGRRRLSEDHTHCLGAKKGFCRLHEMQLQVLKWCGVQGNRAPGLRLV